MFRVPNAQVATYTHRRRGGAGGAGGTGSGRDMVEIFAPT